ncbi:unnamed protein product, partial [Brachionus calyciflorus]
QTVHHFFDIDTKFDIKLEKESAKWQAIQRADIIMVDEISMMNNVILERINEILNAVMNTDPKTLFGGKSLIFVGDFFQLPAVSKNDNPVEQLFMSTLFTENFSPFILETNIRQQSDIEFQKFLNNCRLGNLDEEDVKFIQSRLCGTGHELTEECSDISLSTNLCS